MRNSPLLMLVRLLRGLPQSLLIIVGLVFAISTFEGGTAVVLWGILAYFVYTRIHVIFYDYLATTWDVRSDGFHYRRGLLSRETLTLARNDIASIHLSQGGLDRLWQLFEVRVQSTAGGRASLLLHAVTRDQVDEIARVCGVHPTLKAKDVSAAVGSGLHEPPEGVTETPSVVTSAVSLRNADYWLISLTYGKYMLLIPVLWSLISRISGNTGFAQLEWTVEQWRAHPGLALAATPLILAASVAYGALVAYLKYAKMLVRVEHDSDGILKMKVSRGLISTVDHSICVDRIDALEMRQNVAMRVFGRHSLRVIVRGQGSGSASRTVVIPVGRHSDIDAFVVQYLPRLRIASRVEVASMHPLLGWGAGLMVGGAVAGSLAALLSLPGAVAITALVVIATAVAQLAVKRADFSGESRLWLVRSGVLGTKAWVLPSTSPTSTAVYGTASGWRFCVLAFRVGGTVPRTIRAFLRGQGHATLMEALSRVQVRAS
ncbi:PH domain-containing protein [Arthrobacter bambusae]|uniref:PH domain-containing protein n=1 Tax=Arthrobacter bambusae TaxID=1338426 RepID=UPI0027894450|nr:PH domain-containing protein [Arthrobacter bambusae]MDQ0028961.1 putative membrane protein YdbT with pleckstrin-like domain [Arthrobacter bambusae]MDQ0098637.1 putative membrane protein YdbT with pleckstrin-like domain [Arthrobacter bambusae]